MLQDSDVGHAATHIRVNHESEAMMKSDEWFQRQQKKTTAKVIIAYGRSESQFLVLGFYWLTVGAEPFLKYFSNPNKWDLESLVVLQKKQILMMNLHSYCVSSSLKDLRIV